MISQLRGIILEKKPPLIVIDVNGIGYEVDAPMTTFDRLPDIQQTVRLYTHFVVREDAQQLYGFFTEEERALFRTLLRVNGVGPRLGLTILSKATPDEFVQSVLNNDTAGLVRLPGIGQKTAERLIIEMRDKLAEWQPELAVKDSHDDTAAPAGRHSVLQDAIAALISLGYKQQEAKRVVTRIDNGHADSEALIRHALKEML